MERIIPPVSEGEKAGTGERPSNPDRAGTEAGGTKILAQPAPI
jgi:hypothetical protein